MVVLVFVCCFPHLIWKQSCRRCSPQWSFINQFPHKHPSNSLDLHAILRGRLVSGFAFGDGYIILDVLDTKWHSSRSYSSISQWGKESRPPGETYPSIWSKGAAIIYACRLAREVRPSMGKEVEPLSSCLSMWQCWHQSSCLFLARVQR